MTDDDRHKCDECEFLAFCDIAYTAEAEDCDMVNTDPDLDDEAAMPDADAYREWRQAVYGF